MMSIIQEATLPKLSQTSLYKKFNEVSHISDAVKSELDNGDKFVIKPSDVEELMGIIKINGDAVVKKAVNAFVSGSMVIIFNKDTSQIPNVLPYIVINKGEEPKGYVFADKCVSNINSTSEYRNLMAAMEACYLAMEFVKDQKKFTMNSQLVLTLCDTWMRMISMPLESKLYMKGDNLTKAMLYIISYFYKTLNDEITVNSVPFKRFIRDTVEPSVLKSIVEDVNDMEELSIFKLLDLIKKINPIRYKEIDEKYVGLFIQSCGIPILFAIENIQYLFLVVCSANYSSSLTAYALNKVISPTTKRVQPILASMNL